LSNLYTLGIPQGRRDTIIIYHVQIKERFIGIPDDSEEDGLNTAGCDPNDFFSGIETADLTNMSRGFEVTPT
jgi:hypothetical protein